MGRYLDGEGYDVKLIPPRKSLPKRGIQKVPSWEGI